MIFKKAIVGLLENTGILAVSRYLNRRSPLILMYHRILQHEFVPGTHPEVFSEQMAYVKKRFNVLNMSQLVSYLAKGQLPERVLVLTFDDGHYDFYTNAWPIIKKHGLTATLFVTTDFVDQKRWLWPDALRYILMNAAPRKLALENVGFCQFNASNLQANWNMLGDACLTLSAEERLLFIKSLASQLDVNLPATPQQPFSSTTWPQLSEMAAQGLDIGSHSVSHPVLSRVTPNELVTELSQSQARIHEMLQIAATGICYPNGMPADISTLVQEEASKLYRYGVVAYPRKLDLQNLMLIGRVGATNDITHFKVKTSYLTRAENISEYK